MSKTCNNCGNILDDNANICPRCGTQYINFQDAPAEQTDYNYQQSNYNAGYQQQQSSYQQPYQQPHQQYDSSAEKPMSVGSWVGTILLTTCLGIISLILLFVWGFGSDVPIAKKNYCRAMLIVELIAIGVIIILAIILGVLIANGVGNLDNFWSSFINDYSYYGRW